MAWDEKEMEAVMVSERRDEIDEERRLEVGVEG